MHRKRRDEVEMEEGGRARSRSPKPAGSGSMFPKTESAAGSWASMVQPLAGGLLLLLAVIILGSFMGDSRKPVGVHRVAPAKRVSPPAVDLSQAPSFAAQPQVPGLPSVGKDAGSQSQGEDWPPADDQEDDRDALDDEEAQAVEDFQRQQSEEEDANESPEARKEALKALEGAAGIEGLGDDEQDIADLDEEEQDAAKRLVHKYKDEEDEFGNPGEDAQDWDEERAGDGDAPDGADKGEEDAFKRIRHKLEEEDNIDDEGKGLDGQPARDAEDEEAPNDAVAETENKPKDDAPEEHLSEEDQRACEEEEDYEECVQRKLAEHRLLPKAGDVEDANWFRDSLDWVTGTLDDEDDVEPREDMSEEQAEAEEHLHRIKPRDDFDPEAEFDEDGAQDGADGEGQDKDTGEQSAVECDPDDDECFHRQSEERLKPHALPELNEVQDSNWFLDSFDYVSSLFDDDEPKSKDPAPKVSRVMDDFEGADAGADAGAGAGAGANAQGEAWRQNVQHLLQNRQQQVLDKMAMGMTASDQQQVPGPLVPQPMQTPNGLGLGGAKLVNPFAAAPNDDDKEDDDGDAGAEKSAEEGAEPAGPAASLPLSGADDEKPMLIKHPEHGGGEQDDGW